MKTRPAARLLIIDPLDHLLLFKTDDSPLDPEMRIASYWYVPGGGVEPGESYECAARRELWEETGISDALIGPCVCWRQQVLDFPDIGLAQAEERFFVVRVDNRALSFEHMDGYEARVMTDHRWWSVEELQATTATVFPAAISTLLPAVIAGAHPEKPERIY